MTNIPIPATLDELVKQFVALRDKIKEADDAHKERMKPAREYKDQLEAAMMQQLIAIGGDSVKTPFGTVYRSERKTASIGDGDAFRAFVIDNEQFDLLDWKANSTAVADFITEHQAPPPGINYSVAHTVGVRRA